MSNWTGVYQPYYVEEEYPLEEFRQETAIWHKPAEMTDQPMTERSQQQQELNRAIQSGEGRGGMGWQKEPSGQQGGWEKSRESGGMQAEPNREWQKDRSGAEERQSATGRQQPISQMDQPNLAAREFQQQQGHPSAIESGWDRTKAAFTGATGAGMVQQQPQSGTRDFPQQHAPRDVGETREFQQQQGQHAEQGQQETTWQKAKSALGLGTTQPQSENRGWQQKDQSGSEAVRGQPSQSELATGAYQQKDRSALDHGAQPQIQGYQKGAEIEPHPLHQKGHCAMDLIQEPTRYVALFDLPGVPKNQISLCIDRGVLKMIVRRTENQPHPHEAQQQPSGMAQHPHPEFQNLPQQTQQTGGFGKVTVGDESQQQLEARGPAAVPAIPSRVPTHEAQTRGPAAGLEKAPESHLPNHPPKSFYLCRERPHGRIERFIRLPGDINEEQSDAKLENGVLSVSIGRVGKTKHVRVL